MTPVPVSRQILARLRALIIAETGLPDAQVHALSDIDTAPENLPDIVLFSLTDKPYGDDGTDSAGGERRAFSFGVTMAARSTLEESTDQMAIQVRKAALQDTAQGGLAFDTTWDGQEWGSGSGSTPTSMTKLLFTCTYSWRPEW